MPRPRLAALLPKAWLVAAVCTVVGFGTVSGLTIRDRGDATESTTVLAGDRRTAAGLEPAAKSERTTAVPSADEGAGTTVGAATPGTSGQPDGTATRPTTTTADVATTTPQDRPPTSGATTADGTKPASCSDPAGDPTTDGLGDMDLLGVELTRDGAGLKVRFRINGSIPADAGVVAGAPATNLWQLLLANGNDVLYAFSVTQHGTAWETSLVDFATASGDRLGTLGAQSGNIVEAVIPADHLSRLPASFTWWALTNTDRQQPKGAYIGDDCPNGTGDIDPTLSLPNETSRGTFPG